MVTIDGLPDVVLLAIFDFYVGEYQDNVRYAKREIESWQSLVHVCRRWRDLVFGSPRRLNLQLCYKHCRSARKSSDVWPALPLLILGDVPETSVDDVIAELEHSDRIRQIDLNCHSTSKIENFGHQCRFYSRSSYFCPSHLKTHRTCQLFPTYFWVDMPHVCDTSP